MKAAIKIIEYRPEHQPYFESFNRAWIEKLFTMEPIDEFVLTNPEEAILKKGGVILMATYNGSVAGTVGLRKVNDDTYEFTKMAVDEKFRRLGIAEAISYASFEAAQKLGAKQVILYSNTLNAGAIRLYEKIGFKHAAVEKGVYERANVKMVIEIATAVRMAKRFHERTTQIIKVQQADIAQAALIASIGKKSFRHAFEEYFESRETLTGYLEFTYDPLKIARSLKKENNIYLLAWVDGQPGGFAKIKKHSLNELIESPSQTELQKIYVLPAFQGRGVGSALMQHTRELADEINPDHIWLDAHVTNEGAIRFYERNGFRKMGRRFFQIGTQHFEYHVMQRPVAASSSDIFNSPALAGSTKENH
jgi:ribosomal protein S18 acetylase RimI-like enzyme